MTELLWGETRPFFEGVDRGVLYLPDSKVVPWNGLVSVTENLGEGATTDVYFDGVKFAQMQVGDDFSATVEAFTYPEELDEYAGKRPVNFTYRQDSRIHLVYNAYLTPQVRTRRTRSNTIDLSPFTWDISTTPELVSGARPSAHFVIDEETAGSAALGTFWETLYGTDVSEPFMPPPQEVYDLFIENARLTITHHGDGTWTAEGPDVVWLSDDLFQINSPSLTWLSEDTYTVRSW